MCGICGIVSERLNRPENLRKMNDAIIRRGPDDEGYFIDKKFGMAMRRLSILDPANGHQPITTADGRYTIVLNGEIYNFKELKRNFLRENCFKTSSDTEALLYMYEKLGDSCLLHLDGMFAFCIFDSVNNEFFIARDRTGIKPLNYYYHNGDFVFSSEIKSFFGIKGLDLSFDLKYLNDYFSFGFIPSPFSIFKHIRKLEPGHYIKVNANQINIVQYWEMPHYNEMKTDIRYTDAKEQLRSIVASTIKKEMVSDVPIGAFLSGGLDSSIVTYEMSETSEDIINTYTITFEKYRNDQDKIFSRYISQKLGTNHLESKLDLVNTDVNKIIHGMDEPFAVTSLIPLYYNSLFASRSVKVVLSGDGADEVFGGYSRYGKLRFLLALKNSKVLTRKFIDILSNKTSGFIPHRKISKGFHYYIIQNLRLLEDSSAISKYLNLFDHTNSTIKKNLFLPEVLESFDPLVYEIKYTDYLNNKSINENEFLWFDLKTTLADEMLRKVDAASMLNSVEVRVPYLNKTMLDFAFSLPFSFKYEGTGKKILKDIYLEILGTKLVNAKKRGFNIPIGYWLRNKFSGELNSLINSDIATNLGLNRDFLSKEFSRFLRGKSQVSEQTFYNTYFLLKWLTIIREKTNA